MTSQGIAGSELLPSEAQQREERASSGSAITVEDARAVAAAAIKEKSFID